MEKIWRVENYQGRGPYTSEDNSDYCSGPLAIHSSFNGHPAPVNDVGIKRGIEHYEICGFATKKQALEWFSKEELKWLEEKGYYLCEIEVFKVTAWGAYQVLAQRYEHALDCCLD
jgi:hypothetical protein